MIRFSVFISTFLITVAGLTACTSAPPPLLPWFNEEIVIGKTDFPEGVSAQVVAQNLSSSTLYELYIANESATPLYLAQLPPLNLTPIPTPALSPMPPVSPAFIIVSSTVYEWTRYVEDNLTTYMWEEDLVGSDEPKGLYCYIWQEFLKCGSVATVLQLKPLNQYGFGGDRPNNPEIPPSQSAELVLYYDERPVYLPLEINYSLNLEYPSLNPIKVERLAPVVGVVCFSGVLFLGLWLFSKFALPKKDDQKKV